MTSPGMDPHLVSPNNHLWRVASRGNALRFSQIDPFEANSPKAGNRFDVPGGGVLYASTEARGCFAETLARLRPSPAMRGLDFSSDPHHMQPGSIARDWRLQRRKYELEMGDPLPFVDVEHEETRAWMTDLMGPDLERYQVQAIDVHDIRGSNRLLTREIARRIYISTDEEGEALYSGIRYVSKLGDYECWAIFDGTPVDEFAAHPIEFNDPEMTHIVDLYGLTMHR